MDVTRFIGLCFALYTTGVLAADAAFRTYFDLAPRDLAELKQLVTDLEPTATPGHPPIVVVLHGPEARAFLKTQYDQHTPLVQKTALLDALGVLDVKICATWMRMNEVVIDDLHPFIDTVAYAPEEIERLKREGFTPAPRVRI